MPNEFTLRMLPPQLTDYLHHVVKWIDDKFPLAKGHGNHQISLKRALKHIDDWLWELDAWPKSLIFGSLGVLIFIPSIRWISVGLIFGVILGVLMKPLLVEWKDEEVLTLKPKLSWPIFSPPPQTLPLNNVISSQKLLKQVKKLSHVVIADFVDHLWWVPHIRNKFSDAPCMEFSPLLEQIVDYALARLFQQGMRPAPSVSITRIYDRIINVILKHIREYIAFSQAGGPLQEYLRNGALEGQWGRLSNHGKQQQFLRELSQRMCRLILPPDVEKGTPAVPVLIRELLAVFVLNQIVGPLSDPDLINRGIVGGMEKLSKQKKDEWNIVKEIDTLATGPGSGPTSNQLVTVVPQGDDLETTDIFVKLIEGKHFFLPTKNPEANYQAHLTISRIKSLGSQGQEQDVLLSTTSHKVDFDNNPLWGTEFKFLVPTTDFSDLSLRISFSVPPPASIMPSLFSEEVRVMVGKIDFPLSGMSPNKLYRQWIPVDVVVENVEVGGISDGQILFEVFRIATEHEMEDIVATSSSNVRLISESEPLSRRASMDSRSIPLPSPAPSNIPPPPSIPAPPSPPSPAIKDNPTSSLPRSSTPEIQNPVPIHPREDVDNHSLISLSVQDTSVSELPTIPRRSSSITRNSMEQAQIDTLSTDQPSPTPARKSNSFSRSPSPSRHNHSGPMQPLVTMFKKLTPRPKSPSMINHPDHIRLDIITSVVDLDHSTLIRTLQGNPHGTTAVFGSGMPPAKDLLYTIQVTEPSKKDDGGRILVRSLADFRILFELLSNVVTKMLHNPLPVKPSFGPVEKRRLTLESQLDSWLRLICNDVDTIHEECLVKFLAADVIDYPSSVSYNNAGVGDVLGGVIISAVKGVGTVGGAVVDAVGEVGKGIVNGMEVMVNLGNNQSNSNLSTIASKSSLLDSRRSMDIMEKSLSSQTAPIQVSPRADTPDLPVLEWPDVQPKRMLASTWRLIDKLFQTDSFPVIRAQSLKLIKNVIRHSYMDKISGGIESILGKVATQDACAGYLDPLFNRFWPNGIWHKYDPTFTQPRPRTIQEIETTKLQAKNYLTSTSGDGIPALLQLDKLLGRQSRVGGLGRLFNLFQHQELNRILVCELLEVLVEELVE